MDLSNGFILMCFKAKEIQELWKPEYEDYTISRLWVESTISDEEELGNSVSICEGAYSNEIWIPRQDQLQDMINNKNNLSFIFEWIGDNLKAAVLIKDKKLNLIDIESDSFEKCWIIFVMKNEFNKTWDGNNWI